MKAVISSGHGKYVSGAIGIINEVDEARKVVSQVCTYLKDLGEEVSEYHDDTSKTQTANINAIVAFHNGCERDLDVSVHFNAFEQTESPRGVEVLYYNESELAARLSQVISGVSGLKNRGAKQKKDLGFLSGTAKPAVLIEVCFVDSTADVAIYKSKFDEICKAIAEVISGKQIDINNTVQNGTQIMGTATATVLQGKIWAKGKGATELFISLADIFWNIAERVGINPVVAYAQSAKETGYGKFGGVLDESYCNPCGMKTSQGGGDYDANAHMRFISWAEGIQAQVDHLALYAGAEGYPKLDTPDPRHFPYLLGSVSTVEELGGKWAPSETYGKEIVMMIDEINTVKTDESTQPPDWQQTAFEKLVKAKIIVSPEYWAEKLDSNITVGEVFALIAASID